MVTRKQNGDNGNGLSVTARQSRIETRLDHLEAAILKLSEELSDKLAQVTIDAAERASQLAKENAVAAKAPWQVIVTSVGVGMSIIVTIGYLTVAPLQTSFAQLHDQVTLLEHTKFSQVQHDDLAKRVDALTEVQKGRTSQFVHAEEWTQYKADYAERQRLQELRMDQFATRENFDTWKAERNKLIDTINMRIEQLYNRIAQLDSKIFDLTSNKATPSKP